MVQSPSWPASPGSTDRHAGDFTAGSADDGIHVAVTSSGTEVILAPTVVAELSGDALPQDWFVEAWKDEGKATLTDRGLHLEGTRAGHSGLFGSVRSLEFAATFTKRPHQHVGFGTNFKDVPWVSFSTKFGHSLYARSNFFVPEDTRLPASLLGEPHRFRIDWNVIDLAYWVDGRRVAYQLVPIVGYMRPLASNGSMGGDALVLEWVRMSPYRRVGTFISRVHAGGGAAVWIGCEYDADEPPGTGVAIELRAGDTEEPDGTWSPWVSGGATGRFAQYRARLTTEDPTRTPLLREVTLRYSNSDGSGPGSSSSGSS